MAIVIYVLTFLAGFVVVGGVSAFASFNGASYFKDAEWGFIILLGLALVFSIAAGIIGGSVAAIWVGVRRGDAPTAIKTVVVLIALLAITWVIQSTRQHQSLNLPSQQRKS